MLKLNDGRSELWQWDTGRKLTVDADCSQIHFSNKIFGRSIDVDVVDGVAIIPDVLLQTDNDLNVWAFVGTAENGYTKISKVFKVNKRNKPSDYVFTPTDQTTLGEILDRIEDLENRPSGDISKEDIQNAVSDYLDKNPVSIEEKDPTVPAWAKQPNPPEQPTALPNPHKLTLTGAVTAEYDGSEAVEVKIPEGGSGGIEVTGAEVGQTIVVKAVDENGKPTEWGAVDFPEGGGSVVIPQTAAFDIRAIGQKIANCDFSRIVLLGDSITDGYGGTDYNGNKSSAKSTNTGGYCWANMFKKYIEERYGIPVENFGYYGTNAAYQYGQISNLLQSTDLVIWLSGTNNRISANVFSDYTTNIARYVSDIQSKVAALVFIPCVPSTEPNEEELYKTTQDINDVAFKQVYGRTYYIDMYSKYIEYCDKMGVSIADTMYDHVHPNNVGYLNMFLILCRELGLPLYIYTDFSYEGEWWHGQVLLIDTGMSYNSIAFLKWDATIVPVMQMAQYDKDAKATLFSGKTLKKIKFGGSELKPGTLTIGTVDLNSIGTAPTAVNQTTVEIAEDGTVVFKDGFYIPSNHTIAIGAESDTARLCYTYSGVDTTPITTNNYMYTPQNWIDQPAPTIAMPALFFV